MEKLAEVRNELLILRMENGFTAMDAKFAAIDAKFAAADSRFDMLLKALNTDRRLELLEAAQAKLPPPEERHA